MPQGPLDTPFQGYNEAAILTAAPAIQNAWMDYAAAWMQQEALAMPALCDRVAEAIDSIYAQRSAGRRPSNDLPDLMQAGPLTGSAA